MASVHPTNKRFHVGRLAIFAGAALFSTVLTTKSFALVDVRVSGGMYNGTAKVTATGSGGVVAPEYESIKNKGTQITANVDISPLPLVPFSIGLFYSSVAAKGSTELVNTKWSGARGGIDFAVWAPVPKIKPYLRAGYYMFGKEKLTLSLKDSPPGVGDVSTAYEGSAKGYQIGLGVGFSLAPFVSIYLDYSMDKTTLTTKSVNATVGSTSSTVDLTEDFKAKNDASTISVGLGVSI